MKFTSYTTTQYLRGVQIWNPTGPLENHDLQIVDGRVSQITQSSEKPSGLVLIPSGVDTQVHLRVPGQSEKETARTGCLAALHGGVGAFLTMPNTRPVIDTPEVLKAAQEEVQPITDELGIKVMFSAAVTEGQKSLKLAPIEQLAKAGAVAFTDDGRGVATDELMSQAFAVLEKLNLPLLQHAEIAGHGGVLAPGPAQRALGLAPYFDDPEVEMVRRDLKVLEKFPRARYHVLHISSARVVPLLAAAKAKGFHVTGEVTPHHLLLSCDDIDPSDSSFKMNPPLRSLADRTTLIQALKEGIIDWCATDHAPHEPAAKGLDFRAAAFGTVALESFFRTLLALYHSGHLTRERLVQVFSTRPARFLGLGQEWGQIEVGLPIRAILVDPDAAPQPVTNLELHSQSLNSCFHKSPVPGKIHSHFTTQGRFDLGGLLL